MAITAERMYLRFATDADAAALAALRTDAMRELNVLAGEDTPAFARRAERELRALLNEGRVLAWVLVADGRVAGSACMLLWDRLPYPGTSRHAELAGVYVAPEYRRRGIARELVREALASVNAIGVRRVFVAPTSLADPLYRSFGFENSAWLRNALAE